MASLCAARAMKNARHLQAVAPHVIPRIEPAEGFPSLIPIRVLGSLHMPVKPREVADRPELMAVLRTSPPPRPRATPAGPLFSGTLYFVKVVFQTQSGPVAVPDADLATAMQFANLAATPIAAYASQYGPNRLAVSLTPLAFTASVPGGRYNDQTLQGWANAIASQNGLSGNACLVFLNPPGVVNADADPSQGIGGYHGLANLPYCFVNVGGSGLTVDDGAGLYALALSHEIAEMDVDPRADLTNPEACDPCGPNCQTAWIDYFDARGGYLGTSQSFPPPFSYAFLINGIVKPSAATQCPAPAATCRYAPP